MKKVFFLALLAPFFVFAEKPFVTPSLLGQLGNQLFQVATAYATAKDHDAELLLPDIKDHSLLPLADLRDLKIIENYKTVFSSLKVKNKSVPIEYTYKDPAFGYSEIPYQPNMRILGYFQSYKYFDHHKEDIISLFSPSEDIISYLKNKYASILEHPKTVAVHVRTYQKCPKEFYFLGWDYFLQAMDKFPSDHLFVFFSDNIGACKRTFLKKAKGKNMVFIEKNTHYHDLYLMSLCKHNIISNSSFSWWGAYLNKNPEKIVYSPSPYKWFSSKMFQYPFYNNMDDLVPKDWIILGES